MAPTRLRLPYPTVVTFERALARLDALVPGDRIDRALLIGHGFKLNAVNPLIDAFRFLRMVDGAGTVRIAPRSFRSAPGAHVIRALGPVLERLTPPYPSRKALGLALWPVLDMTASTVPLAATLLVWLAARAGIELITREGAKPGARPGVPRLPRPATTRRVDHRAGDTATPGLPGTNPGAAPAAVTFQLMVDRKTSKKDLERMIREVNEAIGRGGR